MSGKKLDIIVQGATGYTGKLVCAYLAEAASAEKMAWGISGRSRAKLEEVAAACGAKAKAGRATQAPEVLVADSMDEAAVRAVAERAKVVIACAGPFSKYGMPMVAACVAAGTHYVDIDGEFPFVREMIEKYHEEAERKGVMLMPCSGFDCVGSDMVNAYTHDMARERGLTLRRVEVAFHASSIALSRGTIESVIAIRSFMKPADASPLSLVPAERRDVATPATTVPYYNRGLGAWVTPFVMAQIDERVVRRANATSLDAGRRESTYVEMMRAPGFVAAALSWLSSLVLAAMFLPGVSSVMRKFVFPAEGEGPKGDGNFRAWAMGYASASAAEPSIRTQFVCKLEPYQFTAISASETAMALVAGELNPGVKGGVLTTGAALSKCMPRRLMSSGVVTYSVDEQAR